PPNLGHVARAAGQRLVADPEVERQLQALRHYIDADHAAGAQFTAERSRGQADRAETGDQHRVVPSNPDLLQPFVHRAESTGHLRAIGIREFAGQVDQVFLLGQEVFGHAAIALPAVGAAVTLAGAGDHIAAPAIVADAAPGDVIDD